MSEQLKGEVGHDLENLENQKYKEFQIATEEESLIMKEIDNVFVSTPDRKEAEKIVLETLAPRIDEAMKKTKQALENWLNEMKG